MTEYKVQMFRCGKWQSGSLPFVGIIPVTDNIETARATIEKAKSAWGKCKDIYPFLQPTKWRILSRTITPWGECE